MSDRNFYFDYHTSIICFNSSARIQLIYKMHATSRHFGGKETTYLTLRVTWRDDIVSLVTICTKLNSSSLREIWAIVESLARVKVHREDKGHFLLASRVCVSVRPAFERAAIAISIDMCRCPAFSLQRAQWSWKSQLTLVVSVHCKCHLVGVIKQWRTCSELRRERRQKLRVCRRDRLN